MGSIANEAPSLERVALRYGERLKFLAALGHICPIALAHLSGVPFSVYERVIQRDFPADERFNNWHDVLRHVTPADLVTPDEPLYEELAAAIASWSKLFRLRDDWVIAAALETLGGWCFGFPRDQFFMISGTPNMLERRIKSRMFDASVSIEDTWLWWEETRDVIRRRMRASFDRQLAERLNQIEADIKSYGFVYTPPKKGKAAKQHYEWLARYQVAGEDFSEIGRADRKTRQAVEQAVKETAALIDLTLRDPDPGGRPRSRV